MPYIRSEHLTPVAPRQPQATSRARVGQAAVELALTLAVACLLCLPAISFARSAISATFLAQEAALTDPPILVSPTATVVGK